VSNDIDKGIIFTNITHSSARLKISSKEVEKLKTNKAFGKYLITSIAIIVLCSLVVSCAPSTPATPTGTSVPPPTATKPIVLVGDTHMTDRERYFGDEFKNLLAEIKSKSNGKLELQLHYNGELGFNYREYFKTLKEGSVDFAWTPGSLGSAHVKEVAYVSLPKLYGNDPVTKKQTAPRFKAIREVLDKDIYPAWNMVCLAVCPPLTGTTTYYEFVMTKNVPSLADMKGKTLRVGTPEIGNFWKSFGVNPTTVPAAEVYMALKTGMIDGTNIGRQMYLPFKYHEVCPYLMHWGKGEQVDGEYGGFAMNKNAYDKIPADLQKVLIDAFRNYQDAIVKAYENFIPKDDGAVQHLIKDYKITDLQWSDADCAKVQDLADEYVAQWLKNTTDLGRKFVKTDMDSMGLSSRYSKLIELSKSIK
jgi:TRAP-type C4-dicarboxylate transport system substrate-binding protein